MRPSNDEYYLSMLTLVAARSTCARRHVGAILVDKKSRVLSMGFNGVPAGFLHCGEQCASGQVKPSGIWCTHKTHLECQGRDDEKGDTRRCLAIHAEMNAILTCHRLDLAETLYVSCTPCKVCALALCNTPVKRIISLEPYADDSSQILRSAGIILDAGFKPGV